MVDTVEVLPGINETSFDEIVRKVKLFAPHVSWIHIDIMDDTLIPMKTFLDAEKFKILIDDSTCNFEAHLMVSNPEKYITPLSKAGFKRLIAQVECTDPRVFLDGVQYESMEVGLAIDGPTEVEQIEPYLENLDTVLILLAEAGPSGQAVQAENIEKVHLIHDNNPDLPIEVDQGVNDQTASVLRDAGATRLVSTKYLNDHLGDLASAIRRLKS